MNGNEFLYQERLTEWVHKKYLKKKGKILDAGCGNGGFLHAWNKLDYHAQGADINPSNKKIKKVDLEKKWPYTSNSFDYIFMWHVPEHLKNQSNWIKESHRCLKKGGKLIIGVPDWKTGHKSFYDVYTHQTPYTTKLISDIAEYNNFKIILNRIFSNIPLLWRFTPLAFEVRYPLKQKHIISILEKT